MVDLAAKMPHFYCADCDVKNSTDKVTCTGTTRSVATEQEIQAVLGSQECDQEVCRPGM